VTGNVLRCERGHAFDVARQGYVDLMPPGTRPAGDTAEMIAAREAFLAAGHFAAIARAVAEEAGGEAREARGEGRQAGGEGPAAGGGGREVGGEGRQAGGEGPAAGGGGPEVGGEGRVVAGGRGGCVVEVGAGTGYYLEAVRGARAGIALDSSRYAARRAARAGLGAVVCDVWRELPVRDGVAEVVLCVFAPRNAGEMRRILAPGGRIVVVTPTPRHLAEIAGPLGLVGMDARKEERLEAALGAPRRRREVEATLRLSREDVRALIAMGPSARHVDADAVARAADVTLSVSVGVY